VRLHNYLIRLQTIIESRQEIDTSDLLILQPTKDKGAIRARLRFYDGSSLELSEEIEVKGDEVVKLRYSYHYQKGDRLVFRYDNAPHHPELPTFPHHKHVDDRVEACQEPDFHDVLREIDARLYPQPVQS
jgi:hypothetical protein